MIYIHQNLTNAKCCQFTKSHFDIHGKSKIILSKLKSRFENCMNILRFLYYSSLNGLCNLAMRVIRSSIVSLLYIS